MPLITRSGYYRDKSGNKVWVRRNKENWLDGLPYVVCYERGRHPSYTVNEEGLIYPDDHVMFRDTQGYWQPNFWGWPRMRPSDYDLVQRAQ